MRRNPIQVPSPPEPPNGHPRYEFFESQERTMTLKEIGERLEKIGSLLSERGDFKLGGTQVSPPDPCPFILRFERMPRGELSLKLELKWEDVQNVEPRVAEQPLAIE